MREIVIIVYIILVLIVSYSLTIPGKIDENNIVSENEIARYKNSLSEIYEKYGKTITEEELEKEAQKYKEDRILLAKASVSGMPLGEALKTTTIISLILLSIACIIIFLKRMHRKEITKGHF